MEKVVFDKVSGLSDESFKKILNNMGDPVFVKDDQSRLVLVNDAFCEIFGRQRAEILGKTLAEDVRPEEREHFLRVDKQVITDGKESVVEEQLTVRDGVTRTITTRKTRFTDESGNRFLVGVIRDITEQKQAEELDRRNKYNEFLLIAAQILSRTEKEPKVALQELSEKLSQHFQAVCDISVLDSKTGVIKPQAIHHQDPEVKQIILELFATNEVRKGEGLVGRVIETGEEILIKKVPDSMKVGPARVDKRIIPESLMYVALRGEKEVLGSLNLSRLNKQSPFTDLEIEQIRSLGEYLSLFIENVLLREEQEAVQKLKKETEQRLAREKEWTEFKLEVSSILSDVEADLNETLQHLCERITDFFDVVTDVHLVNESRDSIVLTALHHHNPDVKTAIEAALKKRELKIGEGMVGKAVATGKEFFVEKLPKELKEKTIKEGVNPIMIPCSFAYIPLKAHGKVLGTLDLTRLTDQAPINHDELFQMRDLTQHAARFIENRLLQAEQQQEIQLRIKAEQRSERAAIVLERMEAETRAILNTIPIYIARISKDFRYRFLNEAYRTLGVDPRKLEGRSIVDFMGEKSFQETTPYFERVLNGELVNYEFEGMMGDGGYHYFNVALAPEYSEKGEVVGFYSCSTDMTGKVEAEKQIRLSQERLESLSLNSGDAFFFHDMDQNILDVNQVATDMLGYSREELLSMKANEIDPVWKGSLYQKFLKKLELNYPQTFDTEVVRKDGEKIPVEVRFVKRKEGGETYIQSLIRDRTEKRDQELKLQRSEQHLRLIFNNVEDYIATISEDGIIESVNKTTQGLKAEDIVGVSVFDFYPDPEIRRKVERGFDLLRSTGKNFEVETTSYTGADGSVNIYYNKYIAKFHEGKFFKAILIIRDVTLERNREHSVMNAVLRGQEQERKRLGAELHDGIGQVLSAIGLQVSQLKEGLIAEEPEKAKEKLSYLNDSLQDAIREVRNISHDLMPEVVESFGLKEALNQTCSNLRDRAGVNVKFNHIDLDDRYDPLLEVNLYRITQELLTNIQKHAQSSNVFVSLMDHGDSLNLTVEDDGQGFDTKDEYNGIGLRNIQSRVKMLRGHIDIESDPNSGTLINIEVPKPEKS